MQMQELALKGEEQKRKAARDEADIALRKMEIEGSHQAEMTRIELEAQKFGATMEKDKETQSANMQRISNELEIAGNKMGMDAAKSHAQLDVQKGQITAQLIAAKMNADANSKAKETNNQKKDKK
jgi:hypothetical protein